ncbi:tRNA lysidine(34) synthetase TilS [Nocardioides jishulii]|uniref:tRNA(Ile)-lysidine synthase n=1 Tax=Nocardioides jishulii TaxID=2575440 RepID=A0A4U2YTZ8_9ACTN|nr:tRNA lysidine(34) synthetase TilS [Nocardioides jishulii]QCX28729.1 tRNA lysidine(34) synthetase TilS [Nocardioides jishulii]TKI64375.1 tRNA lysidine(34) synthetase TilS [Nocardioides jishulii]
MTLHPAVAAVRLGVRRVLAALPPEDDRVVLVACSGGADSLALLSACVFEARSTGDRVVGVTVDHGLQEGSRDQARHTVSQMSALGADETYAVTVTVSGEGQGPEAAARQARYAVLDQVAERVGAAAVLLGHTLDDQAETVLLGLTRGSGGRSVAGMRREFDRYRRPLLDVRRAQTEAACVAEGITFWSDPHNADPRFLRSRVRRDVLPVLEQQLGPGVAETLARTADSLRVDMEALDEIAEEWLARPDALLATGLGGLPAAVRRRVLRAAAVRAGAIDAELFHAHVLATEELVTAWRGQKWIDLPGHLRALRRDGEVVFEPAPR